MSEPDFAVLGIGNALVDVISSVDDGFITAHDLSYRTRFSVSEKYDSRFLSYRQRPMKDKPREIKPTVHRNA